MKQKFALIFVFFIFVFLIGSIPPFKNGLKDFYLEHDQKARERALIQYISEYKMTKSKIEALNGVIQLNLILMDREKLSPEIKLELDKIKLELDKIK